MMKVTQFFSSVTLILLLLMTVNSLADEEIKIQVKENTVSCTGVGPMLCMQVKFKDSKDWENFYSEIEGFEYKEGFRYTLSVKKSIRENVPADASSYRYELIKVLKQKKKGILKVKDEEIPSPMDFLAKHKWKLIQFRGETIENSKIFIQFDKEKQMVTGNSGCNSFFGSVSMEGERIHFDELAGTLMACAPSENKLEEEVLSILRNDDLNFDIAEQTFNLYLDNELVMLFGLTER